VLDADAIIALLIERPERTVILADFDGSLSPIVERPEDARPLPEVVAVLGRLAERFGRVGVISGRPVEFLRANLPVDELTFAGLYGMEHFAHGRRTVDERVIPFAEPVRDATAELSAEFGELVEPKAGISVTVHWRPQPNLAPAIVDATTKLAKRYGLATLQTRMAVELRPPVAIDKGDAVRALVDGFDVGAFAGDDTGDLPAFAALGRSGLQHAIRIGVTSDEAPPELPAAVDLMIEGPGGLLALLARVADEVG
jgi:trehalose 6-phosphate phosphatase